MNLSNLASISEIAISITKDELTDVEVVRLFAYLSLLLRAHEQYWRQHQLGVIDEATLARYQGPLVAQMITTASRAIRSAGIASSPMTGPPFTRPATPFRQRDRAASSTDPAHRRVRLR